MTGKYKSKLHQMVNEFQTDYWNDSCSEQELRYAVEHGAVGATTNPTIVVSVLKKEMPRWEGRLQQLIDENPTWSETEVGWKLFEEMGANGAGFLRQVYDRYQGKKGRLSIQTDPALYRNSQAIVEQAEHFNGLAPNMQVKIPVTEAGIQAIEDATYRGISINATVSFTVAQAIAVADAMERGLNRRTTEKLPMDTMSPVCTIMVGRTDDWLKTVAKRDAISVEPAYLDWAGIACMKKAYKIYQERGYRARLLVAAYRHLGHISEFFGGDLILSMPYDWQLKIDASDIEVKNRMDDEVDPRIISTLLDRFVEFRKAYDENGLLPAEFTGYGATVRTLRSFIGSTHEFMGLVRDFMLPNPDVK